MAYDGEENFVGSFPNDFHYPEPGEAAAIGGVTLAAQQNGTDSLQVCKPRILLMGLRRSGKSSIQKVRDSQSSQPLSIYCSFYNPGIWYRRLFNRISECLCWFTWLNRCLTKDSSIHSLHWFHTNSSSFWGLIFQRGIQIKFTNLSLDQPLVTSRLFSTRCPRMRLYSSKAQAKSCATTFPTVPLCSSRFGISLDKLIHSILPSTPKWSSVDAAPSYSW